MSVSGTDQVVWIAMGESQPGVPGERFWIGSCPVSNYAIEGARCVWGGVPSARGGRLDR